MGDVLKVNEVVEFAWGAPPLIHAEPSHGSHFFHNITALGITYFNVNDSRIDKMDFKYFADFHKVRETSYVIHAAASCSLILKADGSRGIGVIV